MRPGLAPAVCVFAALLLAACALVPPPQPVQDAAVPPPADPAAAAPAAGEARAAGAPRYRCDQDIAFSVRFEDGVARIDAGPRGTETLLRDAGGVTPRQTVYSSTRMRAEFGLGPDGRNARISYADPPVEVRCERETP